MDFSPLTDALASKSYEKIADICDELMLKATAELEEAPFEEEWPFAIHLLSHIYANDINSARFLWKSIPSTVKERQPEVGLNKLNRLLLLSERFTPRGCFSFCFLLIQ
ncbi:hypothetical protein BDE02_03G017000 [Populus trichocarpa]|nr:hypothetical protein BDE02_03G017000 [Populus trichocarpa]KAI5593479.1 hypothetical protein BDE02_03G017000 [Populus trichocarpa]KAI5593480.1 hypothetical protein BDE02_03G017000 [Populus trichocarpa]KAI5593481.1 hypothetical protein BDE02_03G017000 [Populus trichocarpa]